MKKFSDLGIKVESDNFDGNKISVDNLLNRNITVLGYRIDQSKYPKPGADKCLCIHIEVSGTRHVVFTGSRILRETLLMVSESDFPFTAKIVKENRRLEFKDCDQNE